MSILLGAGGAKNTKEIGVGVGGQTRKVKEGYVGVGGVPRIFFSTGPKPLDEYTWDDIRKIADDGMAAKYFKVGDMKAIHLKGTASNLTLDTILYIYILGIDHNLANDPSAKNTIDFGTFKDASGKDIALISGFSDNSDFKMNPTMVNTGGWKSCDMRYTILGSTNTKNGNANVTTATNPISNTLMSCLPSELRTVMKPMTIYTDNVGGRSDSASNVTTTVDYLPLLAEYEIFGSRRNANSNEQNHQTQYAYYAVKNSAVKYRHSDKVSTVRWAERSPYYGHAYYFCNVKEDGGSDYVNANWSCGLSPTLRV